MNNYDHTKIEKKWQKEWDTKKTYATASSKKAKGKKPFYVLDMFPYPSGAGLHVGHPRGYIGSDVIARKMRMEGYNVLHPMGYDAFGLPAEQYAIQNNIHPRKAVEQNVKTFEHQLSILGLSYDWSRKINTTDPEYYKWTQWIFEKIYESWFDTEKNSARPIAELVALFEKRGNVGISACSSNTQLFSAKEWLLMSEMEKQNTLMQYRLAYEGYSEVNWCPELGTVLANDEIVDGPNGPVSERGGYPVEKKTMRQWFMRITAYADRLISGLDNLDWPSHIKEIQKNWIGKSEGAEIEFKVESVKSKVGTIKVFTTRADTLFGVTYVVLAPEHPLISNLKSQISNLTEVEQYLAEAKKKDDIIRASTDKEKSGVELKGIRAINPANGEEVPVWVADYVLPQYGTGAVMAVPAHDERDFAFAKKYNLPMKQVVKPVFIDPINPPRFGLSEVVRNTVYIFLKNKQTGLYALLRWHGTLEGITTVVMGGQEEGETREEACLKEIKEETGLVNACFVKEMPWVSDAKYCASHKNQNRLSISYAYLYEIDSLDGQILVSEEEKKLATLYWGTAEELAKKVPEHQKYLWAQLCVVSPVLNDGLLMNSGKFDGLSSEEAREKITQSVGGRIVTKFKLRDAIFARQRYWGEPIPLFTKDGIIHEVAEKKLPLELPNVKSYEPTGTGESPLAGVASWVKAGYETNTMPGWAGSSWYFLRYADPKNKKAFADKNELDYWFDKKNQGGVDVYVGGAEHSTGHLLYSRFWHQFLFDMGFVPTPEPFQMLRNQGMILASDGRKMSKRWGNVINPDDIVKTYGADTLRLYEMFIGPFDSSLPWQTDSIIGPRRFIERVWKMGARVLETKSKTTSADAERAIHFAIKKVSEDIASFGFNTAVSAMMICLNEMEKGETISIADFKKFLQLLAPFAPYVSEELWHEISNLESRNSNLQIQDTRNEIQVSSIHLSGWPMFDPAKLVSDTMTIVVSVNGKPREHLTVARTATQKDIEDMARQSEKVQTFLQGVEPKRVIYVPEKLINFVL